MMELKVIRVNLEFVCCLCHHRIGVTVECAGKGLTPGTRTVAAFNVACPTCDEVNRVYFEPCGIVRDVVPSEGRSPCFEPSLN